MVLGVFSPLTVGWEVHWKESAENASTVIGKSCLSQNVSPDQWALHSDKGSSMALGTMLETRQMPGCDALVEQAQRER